MYCIVQFAFCLMGDKIRKNRKMGLSRPGLEWACIGRILDAWQMQWTEIWSKIKAEPE